MLKSWLRRIGALLGLSLLVGAVPAEARAPQVARPALWEVSDPDTTIYLFGTIHLLPQNYQWRSAKFDQAMASAQELVVETIVDDRNPQKLMQAMTTLGFANNLPPLIERLPPAKRPALAAAIKKSGMPPQALDKMKTWTASIILLGNKFREMGLSGGVEGVLRNDFSTKGKAIGELETNIEQLSYFDRLPETAQRALLEGAIDDQHSMNAELGEMLKAWSSGDVNGIAQTFDRDLSGNPELQQALIHQRNSNWSKWIEKRLDQPGAVLVAVGAGHLAGKDSVLEMLKKDGYRVRRLQ
ncbi:MAG: TraB/GumN family protein [Sphingomonas sp.]|nr:TraB/GumN family protein [Sphingomonas sp.]